MRRRSKPRVVWLPQTNANSIGTGETVFQLGVIGPLGGATGSTQTLEIPLVLDNTPSPIGITDSSLSDIENSGYRLRRIVGKFWCECAQTAPGLVAAVTSPASYIVTAGIIVRRTDENTGLSYASTVSTFVSDKISPALIENTGDPWVWRRSWTLGNNNAAQLLEDNPAGVASSRQHFPTNNFYELAGGIADGPHIDQKTARVVSSEERLFLDVTATVLGESGDPGESPGTIAFWTDFRVLGSLRTNSGNRRNASR